MGEKDDVDRVAHHRLCPGDVHTQQAACQSLGEGYVVQIPRTENRRFILERVQPSQRGLVIEFAGAALPVLAFGTSLVGLNVDDEIV